jgi:hypothetical protein
LRQINVFLFLFFHPGLTTQRRKNRKIRHEHEILKAKSTRSLCVETTDLSNDTKKHTTKSRETIPLKNRCRETPNIAGARCSNFCSPAAVKKSTKPNHFS